MKIQNKTLAQRTADAIYDMIVTKHLFVPGQKLPNELVFSEELSVSRTTLREAIRTLVLQGVLEVKRGKGTFVANNDVTDGDLGIWKLERVQARLKDLFELRLIFEPEAAVLACSRGTNEEIEEIIKQGQKVAEAVSNGQDRTTADQEFHRMIVTAAHNSFFNQLIPLINSAISDYIIVDENSQSLAEDTVKDHFLIMEFLKARDCKAVRSAMEIHIHHAINKLNLNDDKEALF